MSETPTRKRGRPRAYDPQKALSIARDVFWQAGFTGASLDELSSAMAMNRPSLYGAFGDKEALYVKALEDYRDQSLSQLRDALDARQPVSKGLADLYMRAINSYVDGEPGPRGCFLIGTAATESMRHPRVREILRDSLRAFEQVIADRLRLAIDSGELPAHADPQKLAWLASAVLHSLAVRARAGEPRTTLEAIMQSGIELICATPDNARPAPPVVRRRAKGVKLR